MEVDVCTYRQKRGERDFMILLFHCIDWIWVERKFSGNRLKGSNRRDLEKYSSTRDNQCTIRERVPCFTALYFFVDIAAQEGEGYYIHCLDYQ